MVGSSAGQARTFSHASAQACRPCMSSKANRSVGSGWPACTAGFTSSSTRSTRARHASGSPTSFGSTLGKSRRSALAVRCARLSSWRPTVTARSPVCSPASGTSQVSCPRAPGTGKPAVHPRWRLSFRRARPSAAFLEVLLGLSGFTSGSFMDQYRLESAHHTGELTLGTHDLADVLVRRGRLLAQALGQAMVEPDSLDVAE